MAVKTLPPIRPNAGLRVAYQRKIEALIDEMQRSIMHWLVASYRANEPEVAMDASPAAELRETLARLRRRWKRRFAEAAPDLARGFIGASLRQADGSLRSSMERAGIPTVKFRMTREMNDVVQASVTENVALIRSIPDQHFTQLEGAVMRAVQTGRDLGSLTKEIEARHAVTKRRAAFIARDQSNKATAVIHRTRQVELGLLARWLHSAGGRTQRRTHVRQSGKTYDPAKGWFDSDAGEWIWPGTLPNCRCVSVSVVPGFS